LRSYRLRPVRRDPRWPPDRLHMLSWTSSRKGAPLTIHSRF